MSIVFFPFSFFFYSLPPALYLFFSTYLCSTTRSSQILFHWYLNYVSPFLIHVHNNCTESPHTPALTQNCVHFVFVVASFVLIYVSTQSLSSHWHPTKLNPRTGNTKLRTQLTAHFPQKYWPTPTREVAIPTGLLPFPPAADDISSSNR